METAALLFVAPCAVRSSLCAVVAPLSSISATQLRACLCYAESFFVLEFSPLPFSALLAESLSPVVTQLPNKALPPPPPLPVSVRLACVVVFVHVLLRFPAFASVCWRGGCDAMPCGFLVEFSALSSAV